jgi:O-antigen ligase
MPLAILLLPSIQIFSIYSHTGAKFVILCLTVYFLIKNKFQIKSIRKELVILSFFYCARVVLLFFQPNVSIVAESAKTILFFIAIILYLHVLEEMLGKKYRWYLSLVFVIATLFDLTNNLLLFFFKYEYLKLWQPLLFPGDYAISLMNLNRARVYFGNFPELIIPFAVFLGGIGSVLTICLAFFSVLVAGFRTNLVMAGCALIASIFLLRRSLLHHAVGFFLFIMTGIVFVVAITSFIPQIQTLDRILYDQSENYATIESRITYIKLGLDLFWSNPIIGVGTNSFKDYLSPRQIMLTSSDLDVSNNARDPHNFFITILSEGGLVTFFLFLSMLFVSFKRDIKKISPAGIAFWVLFLYSMANPVAESLKFNLLFILLRYMI